MLAVPVGTQKVLTAAAPPAESHISMASLSTNAERKETEGVGGWFRG